MGNSRNSRSFDALKIFVAPGGGIKDPDATINPAIFITPQDGIEVSNLLFHTRCNPNPASMQRLATTNNTIFEDVALRPNESFLLQSLNPPTLVARDSRLVVLLSISTETDSWDRSYC
jgi:hypothetical protein